MQEEKEKEVVVQMWNRGRDADGYNYWDDIHHPCLPNKDKSEYADTSPNCIYEVCMTGSVVMLEFFLLMKNKYLFKCGK